MTRFHGISIVTIGAALSMTAGLAFAGDGRTLVSGSMDTTILKWSAAMNGNAKTSPISKTSEVLPTSLMQELWTQLGEDDGPRAYQAVWDMIDSPQAVRFLEKRLRSIPAADENRILRLIGELDDGRFSIRQQAAQELEKLGELASPALRRTLEKKPTAEVRRRAEVLLDLAEAQHLSSEGLRTLRAVEVLERVADPEARKVLQSLAAGAPGATVTQEAQAALKRLDKRVPPTSTSHSMTKR